MSQHINIEDYLEPTDPPLPLPAIETFKGTNTLDSTIEVGETMITQGYRIPLQIKQGATTKTADIYIGSSPLTQGQTITKSQSNVDLELFSGDNIIDTSLVNKPDASITYNSSVLGVGERTSNLYDKNAVDTTKGYVLNKYLKDDGSTGDNSAWIISEYINISGGSQIYLTYTDGTTTSVNTSVAFYNSNHTFISGVKYNSQIAVSAPIPTNAKYCRFSILKANSGVAVLSLVPFSSYVPFGYQIPLLVTSGQQSTPHTIYIGDSPLTAGQSVTKASSGTDITLYQGENAVSTTLGNKPEMKIDYESAEVGVGERTKNLFDVSSFVDVDQNNVVMTLNDDNATISVYTTDILTEQAQGLCNFMVDETGNYLFSGIPEDAPNAGLNAYIWDRDAGGRAKGWDKTTDMSTQSKNSLSVEVYLEQGVRYQLRVRVQVSYGAHITPVIVSPMIRKSNTTSDFIPYGYQIPIDIKQGDEVVDHKDIYIGTQPLEEGASVSKVSVGEDIVLASGNNYIDTDLFNKPEMYIK